MVGNQHIERREQLAVADDLILAVARLVDHVVLDTTAYSSCSNGCDEIKIGL